MGSDELAALRRAATILSDLDPPTVWHLDEQLAGVAGLATTLAEGVTTWAARLHSMDLDQAVVGAADESVDYLSAIAARMTEARKALRSVYGPQLAAAESDVSKIRKAGFWGEHPAGGTADPAAATDGPADDEAPRGVPAGEPDDDGGAGLHWGNPNHSGPYLDWSVQELGWSRSMEVGDGEDACSVDLPPDKLVELRDQLGFLLGLTVPGEGQAAEGMVDLGNGQYVDFSTSESTHTNFEVGHGIDEAVVIHLTDEQLTELHDRLTRQIDADAAQPLTTGEATVLLSRAETRDEIEGIVARLQGVDLIRTGYLLDMGYALAPDLTQDRRREILTSYAMSWVDADVTPEQRKDNFRHRMAAVLDRSEQPFPIEIDPVEWGEAVRGAVLAQGGTEAEAEAAAQQTRAQLTGADPNGPITVYQTGYEVPLTAKRVEQAAPTVPIPAPREPVTGAMSSKPLTENGWGGFGSPVCFHDDGPIGTAIKYMGGDAHMEVDGEPLGNRLGLVATDVVAGRRTAQQALDQFTAIRDRLPEGSKARTHLTAALSDMDAPDSPVPQLPDNTPAPLQTLAAALHAVPLVRRDPEKEAEALQAIADSYATGRLGGRRLIQAVRQLANRRHESLGECGKMEIDRAVRKAADDLETLLYPPKDNV